jgi:hypothetical protein
VLFEAKRYLDLVRSLDLDEAIRLFVLVYSVYLDPSSDGDHLFDYGALDTPDSRFAFDGEFRLDYYVLLANTIVLIDATRAQRLPR